MQGEEDRDDRDDPHAAGRVLSHPLMRVTGRFRDRMKRSAREAYEPDDQDREDSCDEQVRRAGEDPSGLLDPAKVPQGDERYEANGERNPQEVERRSRRDDRRDPRRDRDGDGQYVVGEERYTGYLGRDQTEVVLGHYVGAAGGRVGLDRLAVAEHQDRE